MARLKIALVATFALLGLSAAPAQAFGPMMLLMMPMMMGDHQHGGEAGHKGSTAGQVDVPQVPVGSKQDQPVDEGRSSSNPSVLPQHVDSRDAHRSDAEHGR
ncbi:MAG: hypothetical protein ACYCVW_08235 [Rhodocyclaceae bacterium]|jgi:hypothetical protein